ncbi:MAG: GNAT family N-acetyltransferase, partial [Planctomycetia bacterium]|nr:GNAT family N-acetyltransferase [Planctomycetia bacterium]
MPWPIPRRAGASQCPRDYSLRTFQDGEEQAHADILNVSGLGNWTVRTVRDGILCNPLSPGGVFFVAHQGRPVAATCAFERKVVDEAGKESLVGEVGWVACVPEHRGKGLGAIVVAAAVTHLLDKGYEEIYLLTDHWRLPALKTYLLLGFEPELRGADDRFLWAEASRALNMSLPENPKAARIVKGPTGEEVAWRTLSMETVLQPCIMTSWCMKREFFRLLTNRQDIYADGIGTYIEAYVRAGANLCPQLSLPGPDVEHLSCSPFQTSVSQKEKKERSDERRFNSPEDVRDYIETLPDPDTLAANFDVEKEADGRSRWLNNLRNLARGEILFIDAFGQPDFMGCYSMWGYENFLSALALYPEHLRRYFAFSGEDARLKNVAIARAVEKHSLAPFVYGGQDVCFNSGPLCSPEMLDDLYFPHLVRAVEPLHEAGVKIIWHSDGDIRRILDRLIDDVGVAGFQGFQEETGCTLETIAAKRNRDGGKLVLWGSVSVTTTLPYGTVEDVRRSVERSFRIAAPGGGFVLASTSSILPETPIDNIIAMFEHGQKFGREFLAGLQGKARSGDSG